MYGSQTETELKSVLIRFSCDKNYNKSCENNHGGGFEGARKLSAAVVEIWNACGQDLDRNSLEGRNMSITENRKL